MELNEIAQQSVRLDREKLGGLRASDLARSSQPWRYALRISLLGVFDMKKLNYNGFGNAQSSCEYGIGQIGGQTALVFYEPKAHGTSITNMIEALTTHVLSSDLQGQDPRTVRVFEHYDPSMNPLVEWQEVTFKDIGKVNPQTSVLQKMLALVVPSNKPPEWYVDGPSWKPVASSDIAVLSGIK